MKKNIDIGLDIGISSVGWAITEVETLNIIKHGVRLFSTVDNEKDSKLKNEARREARSVRRQINRRKTLRRDFVKMLIDEKFILDINFDKKGIFVKEFIAKYIDNKKLKSNWKKDSQDLPYVFNLRKKALTNKIEKKELLVILYWYINHRGFKYTIANEKEDEKKEKETKNKNIIKEYKYPIDNQISYYQKNGYINGEYNRVFHQKEYLEEINMIFQKQNLQKSFTDKFLVLFKRQRSFEDGPGNEKTPNKYGKYFKFENNKFIKREKPLENIWELTVGKCTFYPDKKRAPKESFTSSIFNLLNDLSNVHVKTTGEILTKKDKKYLIEKIALKNATKKGDPSSKIIKELFNIFKIEKKDEEQLEGIKKDKKDKKIFTHLKAFYLIKEHLDEKLTKFEYLFNDNFEINKNNIFDKIVDIFSKNKSIEKRKDKLQKLDENLDPNTIDNISKLNLSCSDTHSLSHFAMQKMIPEIFIKPSFNQMNWAEENNITFYDNIDFGTHYLKSEWIEEIIATPTVKRSFRQTTKVLNAIFQLCKENNYKIRSIVIEMARETNNKRAKKIKTNNQKYLESQNKSIKDQYQGIKISNSAIKKLWLLEQQNGKDAYTNLDIKAEDVIKNHGQYDIDHIIPYSQSFSNNRSNLVLTSQQNNHKKGNRTPKQFLSPQEFTKMREIWTSWYKNSKNKAFKDINKLDFLTTSADYSQPENQFGFIQRNLVDTRYVTRSILNALQHFTANEKNSYDFKVKTINGKMTNFARNKISMKRDNNGKTIAKLCRPKDPTLHEGVKLPLFDTQELKDGQKINKKSRIWHGHHAEDAYIVTILNSQYNDSKAIEKVLSEPDKKYDLFKENNLNKDGKINGINFSNLSKKFDKAREELNNNVEKVHFSRMVLKPKNTKLFNETLYKGKINKQGSIDKYSCKYILKDDFNASKYFGENPKDRKKLLINKHVYKVLNDIYKNYYDEANKKINPFKKAHQELKNKSKYLEIPYKTKNGKNSIIKIKKLNMIEQQGKNTSKIVIAKNNGNSFYESMEWIAINVYKNKKGMWKIIPINATNHTFKLNKKGENEYIPKKDVLSKQLNEKNIIDDKIYATIYKGDIIKHKEGQIYYVCGCVIKSDSLEVKYLHRNSWNSFEKPRIFVTLNTFLKDAKLIKSNILANKFIKKLNF